MPCGHEGDSLTERQNYQSHSLRLSSLGMDEKETSQHHTAVALLHKEIRTDLVRLGRNFQVEKTNSGAVLHLFLFFCLLLIIKIIH